MKIDIEITDYFNLYNSSDALLISYKIWEEKYKWLPKNFGFFECPVCHAVVESQSGNLKEGKVPCLCNGNIQKQCYINLVLDNDIPIALKYGIANNYTTREKSQNRHSIFDILNGGVRIK